MTETIDLKLPSSKARISLKRKRQLTDRGAFVLQELFKLRRLTYAQLGRLCKMNSKDVGNAAGMLALRLERFGFIQRKQLFIRCEPLVVMKLAEKGHLQAAYALGRAQSAHFSDHLDEEFLMHLMIGTELYLKLVADDAKDWVAVRQKAATFKWLPSNEDTSFLWHEPDRHGEAQLRRLIPDVTLESVHRRYLIELERPTKSLKVVERKIEHYHQLFSPLHSLDGVTGYQKKYADPLQPVVVFAFESEERAAHARVLFEQKSVQSNFKIGCWYCGHLSQVAAYFKQELWNKDVPEPSKKITRFQQPVAAAEFFDDYADAILTYINETYQTIKAVREQLKNQQVVSMPAIPSSLNKIKSLAETLKQRQSSAMKAG